MLRYYTRLAFVFAISLFGGTLAYAQSNIVSTVAGTGATGYSGDGGWAPAAVLNQPARIVVDAAGNKYFSDCGNNRIRKITASGIITTYAGNGAMGFGGDGGPASAAMLKNPVGLAMDATGNLYIADQGNYRIRMVTPGGNISTVAGGSTGGDGVPATAANIGQVGGVALDAAGNMYIAALTNKIKKVNTAGIISTIAGTGSAASTGDGGPAIAAQLNSPWDVIVDPTGNIYVSELTGHRIRKINTAGIISTIAGNGTATYTGDGGSAIAAGVNAPDGLELDNYGNLYFGQWPNSVVRKIHPSGIITTIAGTGVPGYSGDGGPALLAQFYTPRGLAFGTNGILYVVDASGWIRKFGAVPAGISDSFSLDCTTTCSSVNISIATATYGAGMSVVTNFGDGTIITTGISAAVFGGGGTAGLSHSYQHNGTYTIKHLLMHGATAVDSISHSVTYKLCNSISVDYYVDGNANCVYEPNSEVHVHLPVTVEIDSNGVPVDTIVTPYAFNYTAYGAVGDVYTIKVLSYASGLTLNCPSTGIITDTLHLASSLPVAENHFGFNCSAVTGFDIRCRYVSQAGRHAFGGNLFVDNVYCNPQPATLTVNLTDKYHFYGSSGTPTGTGNTITWNFSGLSSVAGTPTFIHFSGEKGSLPWYMAGDTANSDFLLIPTTGDMVPGDNSGEHVDTIKSSYDPNFIDVTPSGCIPSAPTTLQYAIGFENTGNDTAYNIYVMDTLPPYLDVSSLQVITASAYMNLTKIKYGSQVVLKFDFPNIMLPDSSHHDVCHGMVIYEIKTKAGIANLSVIPNRAGIYFDTNPVVLTNTANNTVNCLTVCCGPVIRDRIELYPNPASDELSIKTDKGIYSSLSITNTMGQQIMAQDMSSNHTMVNVRALPPGMYYVTLRGVQGSEVRRFVKW